MCVFTCVLLLLGPDYNVTLFEQSREDLSLEFPDKVRHNQGCTTIEDGYMLEISDLGSTGTVLSFK